MENVDIRKKFIAKVKEIICDPDFIKSMNNLMMNWSEGAIKQKMIEHAFIVYDETPYDRPYAHTTKYAFLEKIPREDRNKDKKYRVYNTKHIHF